MFKNNKFKIILASIITLLPILAGVILWDKLPEQMPIHWGINGEVDGYIGKWQGVVLGPVFLFVLYWFCVIFTLLDPKNKGQNIKAFNLVIFIMPIISLVIYGFIYSAALGHSLNVASFLYLLLGFMFILIGNYLPKCKQNHTIGIKIPWTLNSEENWNATHRFSGKVWVICGVLILFSIFLPTNFGAYAMIAVAAVMVALPIIYSYNYYKRQEGSGK